MITFFRKIRRQLLGGGKVSKYIFYALGEIVLVVIGILIALGINNWNEEQKKQREVTKLIEDIEKDLLANYELANYTLSFYRRQDSIAKLLAKNALTAADYERDITLSYYPSNWEYYLPSKKNIDLLVESEKIVPPAYKPIVEAAKRMQYFSLQLDDTWSNLEENIDENIRIMSAYTWSLKTDSLSNARRLDYLLNNPEYEALALRYWGHCSNYYDKISRYRAQTMAALATIKMVKDGFSGAEVVRLFEKKGMPAFERYSCATERSELKSLKERRASELFGNLTRDTLYFYLTNNRGQFVTAFSIPPATIGTIPASGFFRLNGDDNTLAELRDASGNCLGKFGAIENGFLLVQELN